jgi:hypothetical protein
VIPASHGPEQEECCRVGEEGRGNGCDGSEDSWRGSGCSEKGVGPSGEGGRVCQEMGWRRGKGSG